MKKKLYYVIEKEISSDGETLNGLKTLTAYEIINNAPKIFCVIDGSNEDSSSQLVQDYLDDNGFSDDEFELIQL